MGRIYLLAFEMLLKQALEIKGLLEESLGVWPLKQVMEVAQKLAYQEWYGLMLTWLVIGAGVWYLDLCSSNLIWLTNWVIFRPVLVHFPGFPSFEAS